MSKLPVKALIGPHEFTIEYLPQVKHGQNRGLVDFHRDVIEIDAEMLEQRKRQTLIHELLHGMFEAGGVYSGAEEEEQFISVVSPQILHFLQRNRGLVYYLMEKDVV